MAKGSLRVNGIIVDTDGEIKASTGDSIVIREDDGSAVITVDTAGKVGINTTAPGAQFDIRGPAGTGTAPAGVLRLSTAETSVVDADQLGRIEFIAPLEAGGTDAILVGASIYAEADDTFAADNNATELVFATGASEAAAEKMRITSDGKVGINTATPIALLHVEGSSSGIAALHAAAADLLVENSGAAGISINASGTDGCNIFFGDSGNASDGRITFLNTVSAMSFHTNSGAERMRIDNAGNVGIGTTAPSSALHISAADVAGSGTSNAQLHIRDTAAFSAAQNAGIAFEAEWQNGSFTQIAAINASRDSTSTGQYGGHLKFNIRTHGANVSEAMRILSDGKVGIGTTAPGALLHVIGNNDSTSDATAGRVIVIGNSDTTNDNYSSLLFRDGGGQDVALVGAKNTNQSTNQGDLVFWTRVGSGSITQKMVIKSDGKVGIGTTAPTNVLHIAQADTSSTYISFTNSTTGHAGTDGFFIGVNGGGTAPVNLWNLENTAMRFATNDTQRMTILGNGKVGIGTSAPNTHLEVSDGVPTFRLNSTEGNVGDTDILGEISWKSADSNRTGDPIAYIRAVSENATGSATALTFGTGFDSNNASERMRIKNSGNVGIGTTNPATALTVSGAFGGDTNFLSIISTGTVLHRNLYFTNTHLYFYNGTNNPYLSGTGAWTDASDENIKKNIEDIDYGLETINTLKPRKFKHKADDVEDIGFIAQEVELIVPEVVAGGPDESAGKGLAYGRLTSILTKAVQELSAKNDALEAKVKALEDA